MVDPLQALSKSQKQALAMLSEAAGGLARAGKAGISDPTEALARTVEMVSALGDLAASTALPLNGLIATQRDLADAMQSFADLQQELGRVVGRIAAGHNAMLDALEALAKPALKAGEVLGAARKGAAPTD